MACRDPLQPGPGESLSHSRVQRNLHAHCPEQPAASVAPANPWWSTGQQVAPHSPGGTHFYGVHSAFYGARHFLKIS